MPFHHTRTPLRNAQISGSFVCHKNIYLGHASDEIRHTWLRRWSLLNSTIESRYNPIPSRLYINQSVPIGRPKILCFVPYLPNHPYLCQAIQSIADQTVRPDLVVIAIDQGEHTSNTDLFQSSWLSEISRILPLEIRIFDGLNGPYKMLNQVVLDYPGFTHLCLQDSDDFSHPTRLARQISFMDTYNLEVCSCFELRLRNSSLQLVDYPVHATRALMSEPGHCMLWPASLIKITIWNKLEGCSDTFRFGADTEFQLRACFTARMANYPSYLYARRIRCDSLTGSSETGHKSWQRGYINSLYKADYYQRQMLRETGEKLSLSPRFKTT